ncbi:hypothetical protein FYK55_15585 [Roseiconus nitratireducens]|uniref:Uncharacterized protein n=1 Tax=Roseiconus nitratireducens TaxID=2605748 RepID=A0A5M6D411_9BACT|nr:hypothetical protein [Roseiconus nitratireducens]KAA5542224.1 hypothetical protein FYK55_15585 [Roseiconus nitratireducens]
MPQHASASHLASITPLPPDEAGRVLTFAWKLTSNVLICLIPLTIIAASVPIALVLMRLQPLAATLVAGVLLLTSLGLQVAWAGTYPEWPINRVLRWRLRRAVAHRSAAALAGRRAHRREVRPWPNSAAMVEWLPREKWSVTQLDSAEDVLLIEVTSRGIRMEGDRAYYQVPGSSIIDVQYESVRPAGCLHRLHFVIVVFRTDTGPLEFPITHRDHGLGGLRSEARYQRAMQLYGEISAIAQGGDWSYCDPSHKHGAPRRPTRRSPQQINPYAAPAH